MEKKRFLPIGTVVTLNGGVKSLMITGYFPISDGKEEAEFDYIGCLFPEGIISSDETLAFDHDQIKEIHFTGYTNEKSKELMELLEKIGSEVKTNRR